MAAMNGKDGHDHTDAIKYDHDVLGGGNMSKEEAMHLGELTPEELMHEKKLVKKIDTLIMPLVMLVSFARNVIIMLVTDVDVFKGVFDELHRSKQCDTIPRAFCHWILLMQD